MYVGMDGLMIGIYVCMFSKYVHMYVGMDGWMFGMYVKY
jgi:hypothetical protein